MLASASNLWLFRSQIALYLYGFVEDVGWCCDCALNGVDCGAIAPLFCLALA